MLKNEFCERVLSLSLPLSLPLSDILSVSQRKTMPQVYTRLQTLFKIDAFLGACQFVLLFGFYLGVSCFLLFVFDLSLRGR